MIGLMITGAAGMLVGLVLGGWLGRRHASRRGYADGYELGRREGRGGRAAADPFDDPNWTAFDES